MSSKERFLVTGSLGQIGSELVPALRVKYGRDNVIATDIRQANDEFKSNGPYRYLNVEDSEEIEALVVNEGITHVVHLGALLSATGEREPERAFRLLMRATEHMCNICTRHRVSLFIPSSIAAFGPTSPLVRTPDLTVQRPRTIYGVGKVYAELLGEYFHYTRGLDFRSLRFPGILSWKTAPGGGTTDYAIEIFHHAVTKNSYVSYLARGRVLPMMYMSDCIKATLAFLAAKNDQLTLRTYNVHALSFAPEDLAAEISKHRPGFTLHFQPDFRDEIARNWPQSLDDSSARRDWGWKPDVDLPFLVKDMLDHISQLKH
jgi:threonine 3-dehydrogenase